MSRRELVVELSTTEAEYMATIMQVKGCLVAAIMFRNWVGTKIC